MEDERPKICPDPNFNIQGVLGLNLRFHTRLDLAVFWENMGVPQKGGRVVGGMCRGVGSDSEPQYSSPAGWASPAGCRLSVVECDDGESAYAVVGMGFGELGCCDAQLHPGAHLHPGARQVLEDDFVLI